MEATQLAQTVRRKAEEFKRLCAGLDERTASRAPVGRWSPKEIVSHLCGPEEGMGPVTACRLFVEQDAPELDLEPGNPFFTGTRAQMTFAELLQEFDRRYNQLADFVAGLTPGQLGRKAHIPALKESPLGEYPTLEAFVEGIGEYHLTFHVDHMREIIEALGAAPKP
ncbi:MAG: DinB family protein [Syntrophorhabdales bacterium]|jgi:hypothetical protein